MKLTPIVVPQDTKQAIEKALAALRNHIAATERETGEFRELLTRRDSLSAEIAKLESELDPFNDEQVKLLEFRRAQFRAVGNKIATREAAQEKKSQEQNPHAKHLAHILQTSVNADINSLVDQIASELRPFFRHETEALRVVRELPFVTDYGHHLGHLAILGRDSSAESVNLLLSCAEKISHGARSFTFGSAN